MNPPTGLPASRKPSPAPAIPRTPRRLLYALGGGFALFTVAVGFFIHPAFGAAVLGLTLTAVYAAVRLDRRLLRDARRLQSYALRLRQAEEHTRTILDTAGDGILTVDEHGTVHAFNRAAAHIFGYEPEEVVGSNIAALVSTSQQPDAAVAMPVLTGEIKIFDQNGLIGGGGELQGRRKDGSRFPIEPAVSKFRVGGRPRFTFVLRDLTERRRAEAALRHARDELEVRVHERTTELRTTNKALVAEVVARKRAERELQTLNAQLEDRIRERTAQLETANSELEAFSYSVSHDLRAPLRSLHGFSQALLEDYSDRLDAQARDWLQRIQVASQRMGVLIDDLLILARVARREMHPAPVDLSALARAVADELRQREPERRVTFRIAEELTATGDAGLLQVALENLFGNAWKFTSKRPETTIEFGTCAHVGQRVFFVRDDGAGFDMAYADKLFGPFQRLHAASEFPGTGVGLATVQRIVHRHGGRVWAEGAVDRGATFYFTLQGALPAPLSEDPHHEQ
jgi:PAS domain S-box-containing protein